MKSRLRLEVEASSALLREHEKNTNGNRNLWIIWLGRSRTKKKRRKKAAVDQLCKNLFGSYESMSFRILKSRKNIPF